MPQSGASVHFLRTMAQRAQTRKDIFLTFVISLASSIPIFELCIIIFCTAQPRFWNILSPDRLDQWAGGVELLEPSYFDTVGDFMNQKLRFQARESKHDKDAPSRIFRPYTKVPRSATKQMI